MRITILGASGKIGLRLTKALLERGHEITALVHSKGLEGIDSEKLHSVKGDIHNLSDIEKAIAGSEVVVSTLGSWGTKSKDIVSSATKNVVPAMETAGIKRFASVTGGGAWMPDEKQTGIQGMGHSLLGLMAKPILVDAETHLRLLNESTLDWTAIRSPVMMNDKTTKYKLEMEPPSLIATISRPAVVAALVDVIENNTFLKQSPFITRT